MAGDFIQRSRHGTVFYFRRRVPGDLQQRIGRLHLYVSLRTEVLAEAKRRARALAAATDRLFMELRYMPGDDQKKSLQSDYGVDFRFDELGRPSIKFTDVKPGDEDSAGVLAKSILEGAAPAIVTPPAAPTPTVSEAVAAVLADPGIKPGTVKEYRRAFKVFADFIGPETHLGDIGPERFSAFADHIRGRGEWASKTQSFHITSAQRLFTFYASRNSGVPNISTVGLKPKSNAPAGHDREAFTVAELEVVFRHVARYRVSDPAKWWVTVASALLGTRIEELAQAHLDGDFCLDEDSGIHYLQIDEIVRGRSEAVRSSPKSVKSQAGWRRVPIHPVLVEAGFIRYLDSERQRGAVTAFDRCWTPLRETGGRVKHSHPISKWGGRELSKLRASGVICRERLAYFHSMRHAFVTLLGKAGISEEWRAAIAGHQYGGVNSQVYNKAKQDVAITLPIIVRGLEPLAEKLAMVDGRA